MQLCLLITKKKNLENKEDIFNQIKKILTVLFNTIYFYRNEIKGFSYEEL